MQGEANEQHSPCLTQPVRGTRKRENKTVHRKNAPFNAKKKERAIANDNQTRLKISVKRKGERTDHNKSEN